MMEFITANWELLIGAAGAAVALFVAIAKLTSTKKDDAIAEKAQEVFNSLTKKG